MPIGETTMDQLKEWTIQYEDGLITSDEFIKQISHALIMLHERHDELAKQLASLLTARGHRQ